METKSAHELLHEALGFYQVTHIHSCIRAALKAMELTENTDPAASAREKVLKIYPDAYYVRTVSPYALPVWKHLVKRMYDECGTTKADEFIRRVEAGEHDVPGPWSRALPVAEPKWIDVKQELPEFFEYVQTSGDAGVAEGWLEPYKRKDPRWTLTRTPSMKDAVVYFWQPLPAPPTERSSKP